MSPRSADPAPPIRRMPARVVVLITLVLVLVAPASVAARADAPNQEAPTLTVDTAVVDARWREGWLRPGAALRFTGTVSAPSTLVATLRPLARPGVVTAKIEFDVTEAGAFSQELRLPPRALPGRYRLRVLSTAPTPTPPPVEVIVRIPAPPEGVIDRALVGTTRNGPWLRYIGTTGPAVSGPHKEIWVRFRFLHPPTGRRVQLVWTLRWHRVIGRVHRRYARRIDTYARSSAVLPKGVWLVVLKIDGRVAKRMNVRLR